jgi:hypothetical protein
VNGAPAPASPSVTSSLTSAESISADASSGQASPVTSSSDVVAVTASNDARRLASAILEVLAGMRSITDAALALGITAARYYALEARAVSGLIAACEPRGPGPVIGVGLPAELERLRAERDRLKAEAARYQTLARIAQGAFALPVLPATTGTSARSAATSAAKRSAAPVPTSALSRGRKKRRPTVRALRLATRVRDAGPASGAPAGSTVATPPPTPAPGQPEDRA